MIRAMVICNSCGNTGSFVDCEEGPLSVLGTLFDASDLRMEASSNGWSSSNGEDMCIDCRSREWKKNPGPKKTLFCHIGITKEKFRKWVLDMDCDDDLLEIKREGAETFFSQETNVVIGWWSSSAITSWAKCKHHSALDVTVREWNIIIEAIDGKPMAEAEMYLVQKGWPVDTTLKAILGGASEPTPDSVRIAVGDLILNKFRFKGRSK